MIFINALLQSVDILSQKSSRFKIAAYVKKNNIKKTFKENINVFRMKLKLCDIL